jgi:hypothetical protein
MTAKITKSNALDKLEAMKSELDAMCGQLYQRSATRTAAYSVSDVHAVLSGAIQILQESRCT